MSIEIMANWLRIGGWAVLGLILLWIIFQIVSLILSILSWIVTTIISLLVVGLILFLIYLGVTKFFGSKGSGGTRSRERERIYE